MKRIQVCKNGHLIAISRYGLLTDIFGYIKKYCPRCGEDVITKCPDSSCNDPISEGHSSEDIEIGISYIPPSYCSKCRKPYPWIDAKVEAALQVIDLEKKLTDEDRKQSKKLYP
jgi:hypothetical protein